jgi:hypothetical protein
MSERLKLGIINVLLAVICLVGVIWILSALFQAAPSCPPKMSDADCRHQLGADDYTE